MLWLPEHQGAVELRLDAAPLPPDTYTVESNPEGAAVELRRPSAGALGLHLGDGRSATLVIETLSPSFDELYRKVLNSPARQQAAAALPARERLLLDCYPKTLQRSGQLTPRGLADLERRASELDERRCVARAAALYLNALLNGDAELSQVDTVLQRLEDHDPMDLEAQLNLLYYQGELLQKRGFPAHALRQYERSAQLSAATHQRGMLASSLLGAARVLNHFGRFDEAEAHVEATRGIEGLKRGLRQDHALRIGWQAVVRRRYDPSAPDPVPLAREAVELLREGKRRRPTTLAVAVLNLAVAEEEMGELDAALEHLDAVELERLPSTHRLYWELTHARIALARGQLDAASERLASAASFDDDPEQAEFRLELLEARARLERSAGRPRAALDSYAAAEALARDFAQRVPMHLGRVHLWTVQTQARSEHVALAVELGEPERALCTALSGRALHLQALTQGFRGPNQDPTKRARYEAAIARYYAKRDALMQLEDDAWRKSAAELEGLERERERLQRARDEALALALAELESAPPAWSCERARPSSPGEGLLLAYPEHGPSPGWWFFLDRAGAAIEVVHVEEPEASAAARRAVERLRAGGFLDELDRLAVAPIGTMLPVDFHVLAPDLSVRYSLGVELELELAAPEDPRAALLGPGRRNLAEVEAELDAVRPRLAELGLDTRPRRGAPTHSQPWLLHYAGHGTHEGLGGWASALSLESGPLDSQAILLGRQAPALVVLSACSTAATDPRMLDGGMNLAVALLLAGSQLVVAADVPVDDAQARAFSTALYAQLADQGETPTADALIRALAEIQRADPAFADWRAWTR